MRSGRGLLAAAGALLLRQLPLGQPAAAVHRDHTGGLRRYYVDMRLPNMRVSHFRLQSNVGYFSLFPDLAATTVPITLNNPRDTDKWGGTRERIPPIRGLGGPVSNLSCCPP